MLPGSILIAWCMAVAPLSPVGEKVHMKARAPDIMVRMEYYLHLRHFSLQSPLEFERGRCSLRAQQFLILDA